MVKQRGWLHKIAMLATVVPSAAATSVAAPPVPPTQIGINLSSPVYYRRARVFVNLALGSVWMSRVPGQPNLGPDDVDAEGNLKRLPGNAPVWRMLTSPNASSREATIRCTYDGRGDIVPTMAAQDVRTGAGFFTFRWRNDIDNYKHAQVMLKVNSLDATDPIRNLDCRETDVPRAARFDPEFVDFVRQFKVIRFMDWQDTNRNQPVSWATRHTPRSLDILEQDGVSVEDMVALATQAGADAWFNMPWNADADYVTRFAQYVHDALPRDRTVYVELGNEVWNARFLMSKQALHEGVAANLAVNPDDARLMRYAEKLAATMDIWARVFADRPHQLVRVANCQNGPNRSDLVLGYKDTARHIDALATAPYFAGEFAKEIPANADDAFARMNDSMDRTLQRAVAAKEVARKYGKRYIAYEAGQHIVLKDIDLAQKIQRDPRMYDAYKRYLSIWRSQIGDTIMMFDSTQPIAPTGAWGAMEYLGQPLDQAPKMRAIRDEITDIGRQRGAN